MSIRERPCLYDIMGGSLKIRFTNGCCCIRYHFLVKASLRFGTAGWYCVIKGKIGFFCFISLEELGLCPLFKLHFLKCIVNKILWVASLHKVLFKSCNVFFKGFH